jgi:hypothetical protein
MRQRRVLWKRRGIDVGFPDEQGKESGIADWMARSRYSKHQRMASGLPLGQAGWRLGRGEPFTPWRHQKSQSTPEQDLTRHYPEWSSIAVHLFLTVLNGNLTKTVKVFFEEGLPLGFGGEPEEDFEPQKTQRAQKQPAEQDFSGETLNFEP